ncbi:gluconokinase [Mobiluncus curtisii]|uniref:Gluconokinase n=1 Tax=Mobiluncus curtisii TaxID=2051 RepID=A0A7Y0YB67_9ACTO|nr:FGGY family carbohydrate kinase [Mobiluncus curtisii]MCU9987307.1 gluconokinase [Mobiluncus curtisii]NMW49945.1 gluconokinase [Mobiluncus curtisii]NMW86188.1 gluconokinase [Mobiluncus curtisii]
MNVLVIESSTSSAKAMIYDTEKKDFTVENSFYPPMGNDLTQHDPMVVYEASLAVAKKLLRGRTDIDIIVLSGVWHSVGLFNSNLDPVTPIMQWSNTKASDQAEAFRRKPQLTRDYYNLTGGYPNAIYPFFKLAFLKEEGYNISTYITMGQATYNFYRLTGNIKVSRCMASGSGLVNITTGEYDPKLLAVINLEPSQLPEIVDNDYHAPLSAQAAASLGLPAGIPVVPAMSDGSLNQLGSGALREGQMTLSVGTSGALRVTSPQPQFHPDMSTWCYIGPKSWISGAATAGACNTVDWFKGLSLRPTTYDELEAGMDYAADTPIFLPFIFGERNPGWGDKRKGGFVGMTSKHDFKQTYQAVLEGVLFNLKQCYDAITKLNGEPERILISGGILHTNIWSQLAANVFGRTLTPCLVKQNSMMGAALWGAYLLDNTLSLEDYEPPVGEEIVPQEEYAEIMDQKYQRYLEAYRDNANR